ncbi:acyltransferase family protein [Notoacmeibacter marinus]|uniref:acyltransferase family protein n=1 Tax=Notoacmeibacter marinus TaxID=1876515 RepID=UPI000DF1C43C|nr:acyltransferase family protein [Notoacmeibacter marinus]
MTITYRADIDGLRFVAVFSVLLFHANISSFAGGFVGVDIFFVISGFLITSLLLKELDANGRIDFIEFWARRTRRLVPIALFVIFSTLIATYYLLSMPEFYYAIRDSFWAATYLINWVNVQSAVQYFGDGNEQGIFIHYWSLAVEEQFYVFITLIFIISIYSIKVFFENYCRYVVKTVFLNLAVVSVLSFFLGLYYSHESQPVAFFGTPSRIWQFFVGSALSFMGHFGIVLGSRLRFWSLWIGTFLIAYSVFFFDATLAYPSFFALYPTLGASLIILAGIKLPVSEEFFLQRILSAKWPVRVGRISYSLYLWHWPVFVIWKSRSETWGPLDISGAILLTLLLSVAGYLLIEKPVRYSAFLRARKFVTLGSALLLSTVVVISSSEIEEEIRDLNVIYLSESVNYSSTGIRQNSLAASLVETSCHLSLQAVAHPTCAFGQLSSDRKMVLFGDSHAAQWFLVLDEFAKSNDFRLLARTKTSCAPIDIRVWHDPLKRRYEECETWREAILREIERLKPDIVFMSSFSGYEPLDAEGVALNGASRLDSLARGERDVINRISRTGAKVAFLADTPRLDEDPLDCLIINPLRPERCATPSSKAVLERAPWSLMEQQPGSNVQVVDMIDRFCWDGLCHAANSEYIIMRDRHHFTLAYSRTLISEFGERLNQLFGSSFFLANEKDSVSDN